MEAGRDKSRLLSVPFGSIQIRSVPLITI